MKSLLRIYVQLDDWFAVYLCLQLDGSEDFVSNTPRAYTYLLRHVKALHIAQSIYPHPGQRVRRRLRDPGSSLNT